MASLIKPLNEQILRKPYAGNLHVRFDEEEGSGNTDPPYSTGNILDATRVLPGSTTPKEQRGDRKMVPECQALSGPLPSRTCGV